MCIIFKICFMRLLFNGGDIPVIENIELVSTDWGPE
jgi:hypothetical protein